MAGMTVSLRAPDGHALTAYEVRPPGAARGALVLLQEIFGVTAHIRRVCDGYAAQGYHVVAPALFDRIRTGIELGYSPEDAATGRDLRSRIGWTQVLADVVAAGERLAGSGGVAALGYCWGGTVAWRAAAQVEDLRAAISYYPTQIAPHITDRPCCPVLMHFGDRDPIATLAQAGELRAAHGAAVEIQVYPAGHGFSCEETAGFHPASAALALQRTLAFLADHLGSTREASAPGGRADDAQARQTSRSGQTVRGHRSGKQGGGAA
jgi:carboxymethylenebutenolidase